MRLSSLVFRRSFPVWSTYSATIPTSSASACRALADAARLPDEGRRPTYAELARQSGLSVSEVTNELAAARREFRRLVLDTLREQCATDEEFEAESRALTG